MPDPKFSTTDNNNNDRPTQRTDDLVDNFIRAVRKSSDSDLVDFLAEFFIDELCIETEVEEALYRKQHLKGR